MARHGRGEADAEPDPGRPAELLDLAPVALLHTDRRGVVQSTNRAAAELLGVPAVDLVGEPLGLFLERDGVERTLAAAGPRVGRTELVVARDRAVRVEARVRALEGPSPRPGGAVAWALVDVEHEAEGRRLPASKLEARCARLEGVIRSLPVGVVVVDAASQVVLHASDEAGRLLAADLTGSRLASRPFETYGPDDVPLPIEQWPVMRALLRGETVLGARVRVARPDEDPLLLEVSAAPIRARDGRVEAAVAAFWDVSARQRVEHVERDFVTNAAHELQTPLAAIISAAEVLDAGAKEEPEERDRFITHIRRQCDRLARLVHALLTLARAQTGSEQPEAERIPLRSMLDEIALSLHPSEGVEIRVDCSEDVVAYANRFLLEQALAGLADNAAKYAPAGTILLRARTSDGAIEIEIADEGPGIAEGEGTQLFERFYRGGDRDGTGFGLGLAIVREAVETLHGRVELRENPGGGTSALVRLPVAEQTG